jgi:hypothetical protein
MMCLAFFCTFVIGAAALAADEKQITVVRLLAD